MKTMGLAAAAIITLSLAGSGCHRANREVVKATDTLAVSEAAVIGGSAEQLPRATVYRTSGNFNANVPVTLSADGTRVVSFPAPGDLGEASTPVELGDGYLLDRRGIGQNTVFTTYTYDAYRKLAHAPSVDELLKSVIPGSGVTEIIKLPITASEAMADPKKCESYVADGFHGCKIVYRVPQLKVD